MESNSNYQSLEEVVNFYDKTKRNKRIKITVLWVFLLTVLGLMIWGLVRSRENHPAIKPTYLRGSPTPFEELPESGKYIKLFYYYSLWNGDNRMICSGFYCFEAPSKIVCTQLNAPEVPEEDSRAVWQCDAIMNNGYELDEIIMHCRGGLTEHDPRNGCLLNFSVSGPMTGISFVDFLLWIVLLICWLFIMFVLILLGASPAIICISGGSHMSSSFG